MSECDMPIHHHRNLTGFSVTVTEIQNVLSVIWLRVNYPLTITSLREWVVDKAWETATPEAAACINAFTVAAQVRVDLTLIYI